jgi:hypothetical protein
MNVISKFDLVKSSKRYVCVIEATLQISQS